MTKALIRLRVHVGWSAPVLFATPRRQVSRVEAHVAIAYLIITMLDPDIEFMHRDCVDLTSHQSKVYKQAELDLHC